MSRKYFNFEVAAIILVAAFFLWQFKKHRDASSTPVVAAPVSSPQPMVAKTESTPAPPTVETAAATTAPEPAAAPTYNARSDSSDVAIQFKVFENPDCRPNSETIILPDIFLREFYEKSESWVAIPEAYAGCVKAQAIQIFMFYEFETPHQFPTRPLVVMVAKVTKIEAFNSLLDLQKSIETKDYDLKNDTHSRGDIFASIPLVFSTQTSKRWVKVSLNKERLENGPAYRPQMPQVHPIAIFKKTKDLGPTEALAKNYFIIDGRPGPVREDSKLPFEANKFHFYFSGFHHSILSATKLEPEKNKFIFKQPADTKFLIISQDSYDMAAYNIANTVALAGYQSITIATDAWERFGGPTKTVTHPSEKITLDEYFSAKKKTKLFLIDSRSPDEYSKGSIPGAVAIEYKSKKGSPKNINVDDLDLNKVQDRIKTDLPQLIVIFGRNDLDERPQEILPKIESAAPSGAKIKILSEGYENFHFFEKFRAVPAAARQAIPAAPHGNHAPPIREEVPGAKSSPSPKPIVN